MTKNIRKQNKKRIVHQRITLCVVLTILVVAFTYIIFVTDILEPNINQITASYISFNNRNSTDMLMIKNLKKMSNQRGKSNRNKQSLSFQISSNQDNSYELIIIPINNTIDEKYINYSLTINHQTTSDSINNLKEEEVGKKILYSGTNKKNTKALLRMWISENYEGKEKDISFEIKVKSR